MVRVANHIYFKAGLFGNLRDEKHTVAKAELQALIEVLERLDWSKGLVVWTDCDYVRRAFEEKGWRKRMPKAHSDRWAKVGKLVEGKEDLVKVKWTKAHVDVDAFIEKSMLADVVIGKECADALAKRGAELGAITLNEEAQIAWTDRTSMAVRERLIFIQKHVVTGPEGNEEAERRRKAIAEKRRGKDKESAARKRRRDDEDVRDLATMELCKKEARKDSVEKDSDVKGVEEEVCGWTEGGEAKELGTGTGVYQRVLREWRERKNRGKTAWEACSEGC